MADQNNAVTDLTKVNFTQGHQQRLYIDGNSHNNVNDYKKAKWLRVADGIKTITPAITEQAETAAYMDGNGFTTDTVNGKGMTLACAGERETSDPAQNYVASRQMALGSELNTLALYYNADGSAFLLSVTIKAIVNGGGAANAKQTFSFTLAVNGKPYKVVDYKPVIEKTAGDEYIERFLAANKDENGDTGTADNAQADNGKAGGNG